MSEKFKIQFNGLLAGGVLSAVVGIALGGAAVYVHELPVTGHENVFFRSIGTGMLGAGAIASFIFAIPAIHDSQLR